MSIESLEEAELEFCKLEDDELKVLSGAVGSSASGELSSSFNLGIGVRG